MSFVETITVNLEEDLNVYLMFNTKTSDFTLDLTIEGRRINFKFR